MTRLFFINLGITCLSVIILYLYFRNRVGKMEQKVDLMFQLIQEYNQQQQQQATTNNQTPQMSNNNWENDQNNLISVSDDDNNDSNTDTDNDTDADSEEISDSESLSLNISEELVNDNIKTINLAGAEVDSMQAEPSDDLDEISDVEDNDVEDNDVEDNDVEDNDIITLDNNSNFNIIKTNINDTVMENTESLINMSVKQLKEQCKLLGFTNYKALRKNKLIELLEKKVVVENNI